MSCILGEVLHFFFVESGEAVLRNGRFSYVTANVVNDDFLGYFATDENIPIPPPFNFEDLQQFIGAYPKSSTHH